MGILNLLCPADNCRFRVSDEHRGKPLRCPHCQTLLVEFNPAVPETPTSPPERLGWGDFLLFTGLGLLCLYVLIRELLQRGFGIAIWP